MEEQKNWSKLGALLLSVAVVAGAFGAHSLRSILDPYSLQVYERSNFYHFVHAFGLLVIPLFAEQKSITNKACNAVCMLLTVGIIIFCGSLYVLAISGMKWLGAITPLGGLCFIFSWFILAFSLRKESRE